jgi:DNA-binding transcriptional ArsR family regulator
MPKLDDLPAPSRNALFRTLADPTRRAIFERLCREGELTVGALTEGAGISQPAVSKHLGVLKQAGLVRDRPEGRLTRTTAPSRGPWPRLLLGQAKWPASGRRGSTTSRIC